MVQLLYARWTGREATWLFAVSNAGSIVGLCAVVFVAEPRLGSHSQIALWKLLSAIVLAAGGSVILILAARGAGYSVGRRPQEHADIRQSVAPFVLGGLAVGLSLSCTTYLARDLGSHPAVWLGPFAAYLATLMLAFTRLGHQALVRCRSLAPAASSVSAAA